MCIKTGTATRNHNEKHLLLYYKNKILFFTKKNSLHILTDNYVADISVFPFEIHF